MGKAELGWGGSCGVQCGGGGEGRVEGVWWGGVGSHVVVGKWGQSRLGYGRAGRVVVGWLRVGWGLDCVGCGGGGIR